MEFGQYAENVMDGIKGSVIIIGTSRLDNFPMPHKKPKQELLENESKLKQGQVMLDGIIYDNFEDMVFNGLTGIERDIVVGAMLSSISGDEVMMVQDGDETGFTIKPNEDD